MYSSFIFVPILSLLGSVLAFPTISEENMTSLNPRQIIPITQICCTGDCVYKLVGNGDPHQDYYHYQVSENLDCGNGGTGCGDAHSESHTFGYSVDTSGTVGFLSGGFSVTESWTSGDTYTCNAGPGQKVCVWVNVAHTAYTVEIGVDQAVKSCSTQPWGPLVMESPNKNNKGGEYYCVYGSACRSKGEGYWCKGNPKC